VRAHGRRKIAPPELSLKSGGEQRLLP
jgi:hypothetical protein